MTISFARSTIISLSLWIAATTAQGQVWIPTRESDGSGEVVHPGGGGAYGMGPVVYAVTVTAGTYAYVTAWGSESVTWHYNDPLHPDDPPPNVYELQTKVISNPHTNARAACAVSPVTTHWGGGGASCEITGVDIPTPVIEADLLEILKVLTPWDDNTTIIASTALAYNWAPPWGTPKPADNDFDVTTHVRRQNIGTPDGVTAQGSSTVTAVASSTVAASASSQASGVFEVISVVNRTDIALSP